MKLQKKDLLAASREGLITQKQADDLWTYLHSPQNHSANSELLGATYYFGGGLVVLASIWFIGNISQNALALALTSTLFISAYALVGKNLWKKKKYQTPAGILITCAICLVPVLTYALQLNFGFWEKDPNKIFSFFENHKENYILMSIFTTAAALITLKKYKFSLLCVPLIISLWKLSMDLSPVFFFLKEWNFEQQKVVSMIFGACLLISSFFLDRKYPKIDFAFWGYLLGLLSFWGALSQMNSSDELSKFIYLLVNLVLIVLSVYLRRKIFIIFASAGVVYYVSHLALKFFENTLVFSIALSLLGVSFIFLGVKYQKNKKQIEAFIDEQCPKTLLSWRPKNRS